MKSWYVCMYHWMGDKGLTVGKTSNINVLCISKISLICLKVVILLLEARREKRGYNLVNFVFFQLLA